MALLLALILFLILTTVIILYGYRAYVAPARFFEQLTPRQQNSSPGMGRGGARALLRVAERIGANLPVSREGTAMARRYLIAAGFRSEKAVAAFYGIKVTLCVALLGAVFPLAPVLTSRPLIRFFLLVVAAAAGYFGLNMFLERLVSARQRKLRMGLPDALDLMVIAVESGLGMDQAFISVTRELRSTHREVTDEFSFVTLEMRMGKRRIDALHNLATRTGEPEVKKLVAVLTQTDRFGTSVAEALRTHADFMRVGRRLAAEEKAGKLGVKLVFPIFFFILPAMILVVAGPGLLQVIRVLLPALRNVR